jgi:hypothetical protein
MSNRNGFRHAFIALMLAAPLSAARGADPSGLQPKIAPDFTIYQCVNTDTLVFSDYSDDPVLLFFFDAGDIGGTHSYPYLGEWYRRYEHDGLKILGIHCPEFEPLRQSHNAITAIARGKILFPVGLDMDLDVQDLYGIESLPSFVLIRPGGEVILKTSDVADLPATEQVIQDLLKQLKPDIIHPFLYKPLEPEGDSTSKTLPVTPRLVLGHSSGVIEDCDSTDFGEYKIYTDSREKEKGRIYLSGRWKVDEKSISYEYKGDEAYIRVLYAGQDVWLLPDFEYGEPLKIYIKQDRAYVLPEIWGKDIRFDEMGKPYAHVRYAIPAHIVHNRSYGTHELILIPVRNDAVVNCLFFEGGAAK